MDDQRERYIAQQPDLAAIRAAAHEVALLKVQLAGAERTRNRAVLRADRIGHQPAFIVQAADRPDATFSMSMLKKVRRERERWELGGAYAPADQQPD